VGGYSIFMAAGPIELPVRCGRRSVRITHPDKLLFPADGITKAGLASYYRDVAPAMLPHVRDRPITLHRFNQGIEGAGFMQKEIPAGAPHWVRRVRVRKEGGTVCHALVVDAPALVWLANQNCITPHVWTSRADRLGVPDRLVFDLDPGAGDDWPLVKRTALELGQILREAGCQPFAMLTGSRGIHVVVALRRMTSYDRVGDAARAVADELVLRRPKDLTTQFRKRERRGRLFVDVLRNRWAQTVVAPYAVRALPGAPVATPLSWEELEAPAVGSSRQWTLADVPDRLERDGDAWADIAATAGALPRV
jgi:bifunctional non-homologous end joining protein LigD